MCCTNTINSQFIISLYYGCFIFFLLNTFYVDNCHESGKIEREKAKEKEDVVQTKQSRNGKLDVNGWLVGKKPIAFVNVFFSTICLNFSFSFYINKLHPTRIKQQQQQKIFSGAVYTEGKINTVENI